MSGVTESLLGLYSNLLRDVLLTGKDTGVRPIAEGRHNEVWWAHYCAVRGRWAYSGCPDHTLTGDACDGSLTIRASLICEDCGKHGWITDMKWSDA